MVNVREIRAEMVRCGYTATTLAKEMGISGQTLGRKLRMGVFNTNEAEQLIFLLKLKNPKDIFFASDVT